MGRIPRSRNGSRSRTRRPAQSSRRCRRAAPTMPTAPWSPRAAAQPAWEALPPVARGQLLSDLARLILENRERLARLVVAEQGKPLHGGARRDRGRGALPDLCRRGSAAHHRRHHPVRQCPTSRSGSSASPMAWWSALTAWNYPAALMCRKMGPALLAGNTIVVKSHEGHADYRRSRSRSSSTQLGFPAGRHQRGQRHRRGARAPRWSSIPIPRLITLTGSVRAGKEIFRNAADDLKILRLELGGKAPFIVAEDADIGAAVRAAVLSRFENCGQICICNERMYVHERIADEFTREVRARGEGAEGRRSDAPWSMSARSSAVRSSTRSSAWWRRRRPPAPRC